MPVVANAQIPTGVENETRQVHLVIEGESIAKILPASSPPPRSDETIDASELLVLPGAIDPHVHFNTPGYTHREDFTHASMNAAAGGVTTVIDMPGTSVPPVTKAANLEKKLAAIEGMSVIDFALWGGMSSQCLRENWWHDEMADMWKTGVVGFKTFLISGMKDFGHLSIIEVGQVLQHAARMGILVGIHAEDRDLIEERMAQLIQEGKNTLKDYYASRADPAEEHGVAVAVRLALTARAKIHIVHVASRRAAAQVLAARTAGLDVTMETCPQYLAFTHKDFDRLGSVLKCAPVIKTSEDRDALWMMLSKGDIDFVSTDHAPCPPEEKNTGSAWTDYGGLPGVEWRLPYLFSEGYKKGRLTLSRLVEATSGAVARRFGLSPRKGAIAVGADADLAFIDPNRRWTVKAESFGDRGHLTPFAGWEFMGKVVRTMCRGRVVYDQDKGMEVEPGFGKFIRRLA